MKKRNIIILVLILLISLFYLISNYLSPERVVIGAINKVESGQQVNVSQEVSNEIINVLNYFRLNKSPSPIKFTKELVRNNNEAVILVIFQSVKYNRDGRVNSVYHSLVKFKLEKKIFSWKIIDVQIDEQGKQS